MQNLVKIGKKKAVSDKLPVCSAIYRQFIKNCFLHGNNYCRTGITLLARRCVFWGGANTAAM